MKIYLLKFFFNSQYVWRNNKRQGKQKQPRALYPSTSASDTPSRHPPQMEQEKDAEVAEQARLDRLAKHEDIKQAWQKRNNMIFRGTGKMDRRCIHCCCFQSTVGTQVPGERDKETGHYVLLLIA